MDENEFHDETEDQILNPKEAGHSGINVGGNTVTQSTEHLAEDQRALVRWIYDHARREQWDWTALVRAVGSSPSTWSRIFNDKYRYPKRERKNENSPWLPHPKAGERMPIDDPCAAIARFKRIVDSRAAVQSAGFVETSVWKQIDWLCRRSFVRQKIGFVYGESQIGKTTGLLEYERRNNHGQTYYVEMPPAAGVQLMTRTIAKALHVSTYTSYERLIEDVLEAVDSTKLLIIDEVHRIFTTYQKTSVMRCLDVLRYIHDQKKCGLVLCGTHVFRDQLQQGQFHQYLKQLRRRGLAEVELPASPPADDLDLIARKFGLDPAKHDAFDVVLRDRHGKQHTHKLQSLDVVQRIAKSDGFGKYVIRLQDAAELAHNKKEKVSWYHFCRAHAILESMAAIEKGGAR